MFSDPQFWVFIAFVIFVAIIFKPIKKIFTSSLDNKIKTIKNNIDQAEKIKNEAQNTLSQIKKRQNDVKLETEEIQNKAKEKLANIEKLFSQKVSEQIKKRNELAKIKIEQLVRDTNLQIQNYIVQNAIKTTVLLLEKKLDQKEKQKLINDSVSELNIALKH